MSDSHERDPVGDPAAPSQVPPFADFVLRTPPNWTAVLFLGMLGGLHLSIAVPSLLVGRYGYMSLILGSIFVTVSVIGYRCRCELALLTSQRRVRLRTGMGRFCYERFVPFSSVRAVRIMVEPGIRRQQTESLIELLCQGEDILCPPTKIPRQQALFMAMALNVPLIKVSEGSEPEAAAADRVVDASLSGRLRD